MAESIIRTENLSYVYSEGTPYEHRAIDNVNIEIEKGSFVGLIGHTGSGKSTLIQHLNGLLKPTSGKIYIGGEDLWANPKDIRRFRFKVGLVFQYPEHQLFEETVRRDIAFGPKNMGLSEEEIEARVMEAAKHTGLTEEYLEKSPFELSGGEKRRVAIAGVLAMRPEVLILDEPTAGLDPKGREFILSEIKAYHENTGATVILVSHSMEDVARFASHVLIMNHSKAVMFGETREIFKRVDELCEIGLEVPQISRVFAKLRENGANVPESVLTVAEAKEAVLKLLKKGGEENA
ncbi:MAG: energy-coupling factor transporter ATPase [Oscillospiraceae bacterium]|nr:energy-coupling factor transporter ATPase [Oscillospiraceae bacterium]MBQ3235936.1 energy-coupling factor transporter ATPase [Oscillospiraceae bacterium]MBQ3561497.1 energy-coupling factor transporter ATPase [Oscillospiraceae bacterium]MBQ4117774.1 energy-coupling factor transporter ATPase [Oscillospiraceae bacterium]MBQ6802246.1 energy-coupling factor transporter ATPase [Oscillospiraceae bacterium]